MKELRKENRKDKNKVKRDNHKEETKEYHKDIEKRKKRNSNKVRNNIIKFNILAQAKQQLRECEISDCQVKGGDSHLTRQKNK